MLAPGMAGEKAFECQPATFKGTIFFYGFESVGAAGGCEAALGPKERRYSPLVEADDCNE
jgi:hypothetical protein